MKKMYKQTFKKDFKAQLIEAFLLADIPLKKIRNPLIVQLFTDLGQAVPSETMCREHVHELAESEQGRIKELLMDKKAFLVVDESEIDKKKYSKICLSRIRISRKFFYVGNFCSILTKMVCFSRWKICLSQIICLRRNVFETQNCVIFA